MIRSAIGRRVALAVLGLCAAWSPWARARPETRPAGHATASAEVQDGERGAASAPAYGEARAATRAEQQAAAVRERERQIRSAREEREDSQPPAPMNWTQFGAEAPPFLAMLVNFGIMVAGYYLLGRKPIAAALQNRRDTIAKDIDEAHRMKEEAEARAKRYQAKLQRLDEDARAAREALLGAGEAEQQRIVQEAEAKAERVRREVEFVLEQERKQLRLDLWRNAVDAAVSAAAELLEQRVTPADQERLAEDYLADLRRSEVAAASRTHEGSA